MSDHESFHRFFQSFLQEQNQHLDDLIAATKTHQNQSPQPLINRVLDHYEQYYQFKSRCAKHNVLPMFSPTWTSSLENAFLWIGGWRPSMAVHLLYSKSGLQLEPQLYDLIRGLSTGDLGDLSPNQLTQVDRFQRRIIKEEKDITENMARHQETVADTPMVELSHVASEMKNADDDGGSISTSSVEIQTRIDSTLRTKEEGLEEILRMADDLRLKTLKGVVNILNPLQAVHFLAAAAQLHLRVHEWGKKKDAMVS